MTDNLEGFVIAEAKRLGLRVSAEVIRAAAIDLCGAHLTAEGLIRMPSGGSITPGHFVASLRTAMPAGFTAITDKPEPEARRPGETMTAHMKRVNEAGQKKKDLPSDWQVLKSRMTGLTLRSMNALEKSRA